MYTLGISYQYFTTIAFSFIDFSTYSDMFKFYVNHVELFQSTDNAKNLVFSSLKPHEQHPYGNLFDGMEENSIVIQKQLYEKQKGRLVEKTSVLEGLAGRYRTWKRQTAIDEILEDLDTE